MISDEILNSFFTLMIAMGVIILLLFLIKKVVGKVNTPNKERQIKIISKTTLAPKSHLFIVCINGRELLLGVTEKSITLLGELKNNNKNIDDKNKNIDIIKTENLPQNKTPEEITNKTIPESLSFANFLKSTFKQ